MSDAVYIELPQTPKSRKPFFLSLRGIILLLFLCLVIVAGYFSWWLSQGKVASAYARVDSVVYTVGADFRTTIKNILVTDGQVVKASQPLAAIDPDPEGTSKRNSAMGEISGRLNSTAQTEQEMVRRLNQARADEEKYQKLYQDRVTEHVRALLNLRSLGNGQPGYGPAMQAEAAARAQMDLSRENFERISRTRAAVENELERIRYELAKRKMNSRQLEAKPVAQEQVASSHSNPDTLYTPVAGKIIGINALPGQVIQPGQILFLILPEDSSKDSWIQAWFPFTDQKKIELGQKTLIKINDGHINGKVVFVGEQPESLPDGIGGVIRSGNYLPVRIQPDQPIDSLKPGTKVECQIQTRYILGETWL